MEPFNEKLGSLPLEVVNQGTIATDLSAWKDDPPDPDFELIMEAEVVYD